MFIRFLTGLWVIALVFVGFSLYHLKYEVLALENEKKSLQAQIHQDREATAVLEAEWAYLNNPKRLQTLVEKYLALHPMQTAQIQVIGGSKAKRPTAVAKTTKPMAKQDVVVARHNKTMAHHDELPIQKVNVVQEIVE